MFVNESSTSLDSNDLNRSIDRVEREGSRSYFFTYSSKADMDAMTARRRNGSKLLSRSDGAKNVSSLQQSADVMSSPLGCKISLNEENDTCLGILTLENDLALPSSSRFIDEELSSD